MRKQKITKKIKSYILKKKIINIRKLKFSYKNKI